MSRKSKRRICFEQFGFTDPEYKAEVIPVEGSTAVDIVMSRFDPRINQTKYGHTLARFCHRKTAEKLCVELNHYKYAILARAYP